MRVKKADQMEWQQELLNLLPSHPPGLTCEEIRESLHALRIEKSLRTVQRTLEGFMNLGLKCDESCKAHLWYRDPVYRGATPPTMPTAEALSLRLIEQMISPLLPQSLRQVMEGRFKTAAKRLDVLRTKKQPVDWPEKVAAVPSHLNLLPPRIDPEVLVTVQEALLEDAALNVDYQSLEKQKPTRRMIYPRALLQAGPATYLIVHEPHSGKDPDTPIQYRLDRIHKAIKLSQRTPKSDFNLKTYLAKDGHHVGRKDVISLRLSVSPKLALILRGTALSGDQSVKDQDGGAIVTAKVRETHRLKQWLLGHAEHVEVIKPEDLREWMVTTLGATLSRYQ